MVPVDAYSRATIAGELAKYTSDQLRLVAQDAAACKEFGLLYLCCLENQTDIRRGAQWEDIDLSEVSTANRDEALQIFKEVAAADLMTSFMVREANGVNISGIDKLNYGRLLAEVGV